MAQHNELGKMGEEAAARTVDRGGRRHRHQARGLRVRQAARAPGQPLPGGGDRAHGGGTRLAAYCRGVAEGSVARTPASAAESSVPQQQDVQADDHCGDGAEHEVVPRGVGELAHDLL